jgi:hypothetical protein
LFVGWALWAFASQNAQCAKQLARSIDDISIRHGDRNDGRIATRAAAVRETPFALDQSGKPGDISNAQHVDIPPRQ